MNTSKSISDYTFRGKNIIPENFSYIGYVYFFSFENEEGGYDSDCELDYPDEYHKRIDPQTSLLANKEAKCNCCNSRLKRGNFFEDKEGNLIVVGSNCGNSILRFSFDTRYAKKLTLERRRKQERATKIESTFQAYPNLEADFEVYHKIIKEIREKFFKYLKISEKQVNFIHSLAEQRRAYEKASEKAVGGEKVFFDELEVVSLKFKREVFITNRYGGSSTLTTTAQVTLRTKGGWLIFCNAGSKKKYACRDRDDIEFQELKQEEFKKGEKIKNVRFSKITVSNNDPYFSFGKRIKIGAKK